MNSLFLVSIKGQLFGFAKEWVAGVGGRKAQATKAELVNNRKWLGMPNGSRAIVYDFQDLLDNRYSTYRAELEYYLILAHSGQQLALPVDGRGQWASVATTAATTLPLAFAAESRALIPKAVINGQDILLLPDIERLCELAMAESEQEQLVVTSLAA